MSLRRTYRDRAAAGRALVGPLRQLDLDDPVIVGMPRGGVPIAATVAAALDAPLDVLLVRKIGAPGHPEYGVGAIGEDDVEVLDQARIRQLAFDPDTIAATVRHEREELLRRAQLYRGDRPPVSVDGRTVVLVDDGVATGGSAVAAVEVLRHRKAGRVVAAIPVGAETGVQALAEVADDVVCPRIVRASMFAVGAYYDDFHQVSDAEVLQHLTT
jgi:putative phosphoribosyl transferase